MKRHTQVSWEAQQECQSTRQLEVRQFSRGRSEQLDNPGTLSKMKRRSGLTVYLPCRLAAGDEDGRVVVWDVHSTAAVAGLEDPWLAAQGRRLDVGSKAGGVQALAWVGSNPYLLAVAVSGLFLIWDPKGGSSLPDLSMRC